MNNSKSDIGLVYKKMILETGTSNLLFIRQNKIYTPTTGYYEGNTFKFVKSKIKEVIKKDIFVKDLKTYDEVLLVGSGKGIASVKTIKSHRWIRKSLKIYKKLNKLFQLEIKKNKQYYF